MQRAGRGHGHAAHRLQRRRPREPARPARPDPLRARRVGLRTATIPAATDCLTRELVVQLKDGRPRPDGAQPRLPARRSARRLPRRARARSPRRWRRRAGLTSAACRCRSTPPSAATPRPISRRWRAFVETLGIVFWEVFFLVPMGRGSVLAGPLRRGVRAALRRDLPRPEGAARFIVKVTEAPHYRRHVAQRERRGRASAAGRRGRWPCPRCSPAPKGPGTPSGLAPRGVNSGNGFLFVSHRGEIYPERLPARSRSATCATADPGRRLPAARRSSCGCATPTLLRAAAGAASSATSAAARARAPSPSPATRSRPTPGAPTSPWRAGSGLERCTGRWGQALNRAQAMPEERSAHLAPPWLSHRGLAAPGAPATARSRR